MDTKVVALHIGATLFDPKLASVAMSIQQL